MIETEHRFSIDVSIDEVWAYVRDIGNWAASMPGYQSFELVDELRSKWVLKVAMGALTRTVRLNVEIIEQREPDHIAFQLQGENDPVVGTGSFHAAADASATAVAFTLAITGSGPMAGTMEAMSRPIVPRMARQVGEALKTAIESTAEPSMPASAGGSATVARPARATSTDGPPVRQRPGLLRRLWLRLRRAVTSVR